MWPTPSGNQYGDGWRLRARVRHDDVGHEVLLTDLAVAPSELRRLLRSHLQAPFPSGHGLPPPPDSVTLGELVRRHFTQHQGEEDADPVARPAR